MRHIMTVFEAMQDWQTAKSEGNWHAYFVILVLGIAGAICFGLGLYLGSSRYSVRRFYPKVDRFQM